MLSDIQDHSQIGRLQRPFARPSVVGGIKVVGFIKMYWDRHTFGTDTHLGQTHKWDRHTCGTDAQVGQTHMWDRRTCGTDAHVGQMHIGQFEKHLC